MPDNNDTDRTEHKGEELGGKLKEGVGDMTDDDRLKRQGQTDQASSKAKQAGDDVKDAAEKLKDRVTGDDKND